MENLLHTAIGQVNITNLERCQLLGPQAQPVGQGDHCLIPLPKARGTGYLQQPPDLTRIQYRRLSTVANTSCHFRRLLNKIVRLGRQYLDAIQSYIKKGAQYQTVTTTYTRS
jgi:hypothetical protein